MRPSSRPTAALAVLLALPVLAASLPASATAAAPRAAPHPGATAGPSEPPAPRCDRSLRSTSMLRAGMLTVSPEPGSVDATPQTQISIIGVPAGRLSHVRIVASRSGVHRGRLEPYSQGDGASYVLSRPFDEGERVTVRLMVREGSRRRQIGWHFSIDYKAGLGAAYFKRHVRPAGAEPRNPRIARRGPAGAAQISTAAKSRREPSGAGETLQHFRSAPELQPPALTVTLPSRRPQPGYLFLSPFSAGQAGPMIVNDQGQLVWFHPVNIGPRAATKATDLQVQTYQGKPVLTWWEDPLRASGQTRREPQDVIYNPSYEQVAAVHAGNGLVPGVHEFQITPQGTALIAIADDIRCNLAGVHGARNGSIWDSVIQEIDIRTGLVRWEWNSLDHVSLREAYDSAKVATAGYPFDYFHLNSIQPIGGDGLLISARNTWAMYDISRRTGRIRWRLGGKHSSFRMLPGTRTAWQHDAREVTPSPGPGKMLISVFDDGATPKVHSQSRGLLEVLSFHNHTARVQRVLTNSPPLLAGSQGSVEVMANGDTVVGWGQKPWISEFNPSGQITFDAHLPELEQSYRALRYEWQGAPRTPPSIAVQADRFGGLTVYASWNGATGVASWRVLEGPAEGALSAVATVPRSGFETEIHIPSAGSLVQVQALNAAGEVIGASAPDQA